MNYCLTGLEMIGCMEFGSTGQNKLNNNFWSQ